MTLADWVLRAGVSFTLFVASITAFIVARWGLR